MHAAGLKEVELLVVAIDDKERATEIVRHARMDRPDLHIVARARDRNHVYELFSAGANDIIRETFDSAVRAGRSALESFGIHPYEAEKIAVAFVKNDKKILRDLAGVYDPDIPPTENPEYMALVIAARSDEEAAMTGSRGPNSGSVDRAWLPPGHTLETEE